MNDGLRELKKELRDLRISLQRVEEAIDRLVISQQGQPSGDESTISTGVTPTEEDFMVRDRYGNYISMGDTVKFLTRGRFQSKKGIVYKFSDSSQQVTARDSSGASITRHPSNLEVISSE